MPKREDNLPVFFFFLLLSFFIYLVSKTSVGESGIGFMEIPLNLIRHGVISVYAQSPGEKTEVQKLKEENNRLRIELAKNQEQEKEIKALRDQFNITTPSPADLLQVNVVGLKAFIPGYSLPEQIVIDKGKTSGVKVGSLIVYKDMLVGKVVVANNHNSLVDLSFRKDFSITANTAKTDALGVAKGQGQGEILLDNVVLSENLANDDLVVTKGSVKADGSGAPPGLVIGKIISIDKKPSALFQTAKIQPLFDITHNSILFVLR